MISLKKWPQIYFRRLSHELVLFLPILLAILIAYNFVDKPSLFENLKAEVQKDPKNERTKINFASFLFQTSNFQLATNELMNLQSPQAKQVLNKIKIAKSQPSKTKRQIDFWQKELASHPSSRDILIKLAILNWKLYRVFEAQKNLLLAIQIDPNNTSLKKYLQELD